MEALALYICAIAVHWEDITRCIYVVEDEKVTPRVLKSILMSIFYKKLLTNVLCVPKYDTSTVIMEDICTKPCSGTIISFITKYMTRLRLHPTSDTDYYQIMILYYFAVN